MGILIANKEELLSVVPVTGSIDYSAFKPDQEDAELLFLLPEIGEDFLQKIYDNLPSTEDPWKRIVSFARKATANYAIANYIPKVSINITGSGVTRSETESEKSAFRYQEEAAIQSYIKTAERSLESLLKFAESKANEIEWTGEELTRLSGSHFTTAEDLNEFIDIGYSRRVFRRIKPFLVAVQNMYITPNIGEALNTKLLEPSQSGVYWMTRHIVRTALANLAFADALPMLNIQVSEDGVSIISTAASGDNSLRKAPVPKAFLNELVSKHRKAGEIELKRLIAYLRRNAADVTEFSSNPELFSEDDKPFKNDDSQGGAKLF